MDKEILVKLALCLIAAAVVLWGDRLPGPGGAGRQRRDGKRRDRDARQGGRRAGPVLWILALVAVAAYYDFGRFHGPGWIHHWEQFHYQLGSKYFPELGYDGLYAASLTAQTETRPNLDLQPWARDLRTNEVVPTPEILAHGREVMERFTPARWRAFAADNDYYVRTLQWGYLTAVRMDHGYNPTPTWTFVARLFGLGAATDRGTLGALGLLDPLLLLVLFGFIARTYGARTAALCAIVFGLGYAWRFYWIGGAFLRLDWLVAVGVAVCLVRRERYRRAGALLAYAGMVRIFPFVLLLGPGVLALRALVSTARRGRDGEEGFGWAWRLAQGFAAGIVLCLLAGSLTGRGVDAWTDFAANLEKHHGTWLTNNVGLANVALYDLDTMNRKDVDFSQPEPWLRWQEKMDRLKVERRPWTWALAALFLAVVATASWRAERDESIVLGIGAVFALLLLTCYYWILLVLVPLRRRPPPRVTAAALLLLSAGLFALHLATPSFEMIFGLMSWALALLFLAWAGPDALATLGAMLWRRP
jgi:hypothetical protein